MAQSPLQPSQGQTAQEDASSILSVRPFPLRSALLLFKWPSGKAPERDSWNPAPYSTLASIVVIYRNVVRHLLKQNVSDEAIGQIQHALSDPSEARLWKFILCSWDPDSPTLEKETIEAMLALRSIPEGHAPVSYTAFERSEACKKIWETEHLQARAIYTKGESRQWEKVPSSDHAQYKLLPQLNLHWDGEGALESKLQHHISPFELEYGGQSIQPRWTMPLVFKISYQSKTEMPGIFERIRSLELYDPALPEEQRSASSRYHYRLFGVVRTAKAQDDPQNDLVRVYNPFGHKLTHHVYPDTEFDSILFPSTWTLSEPNRQFFLYYGLIREHLRHPKFTPREVPRDRIAWMRDPESADLLVVPVNAVGDRIPAPEPWPFPKGSMSWPLFPVSLLLPVINSFRMVRRHLAVTFCVIEVWAEAQLVSADKLTLLSQIRRTDSRAREVVDQAERGIGIKCVSTATRHCPKHHLQIAKIRHPLEEADRARTPGGLPATMITVKTLGLDTEMQTTREVITITFLREGTAFRVLQENTTTKFLPDSPIIRAVGESIPAGVLGASTTLREVIIIRVPSNLIRVFIEIIMIREGIKITPSGVKRPLKTAPLHRTEEESLHDKLQCMNSRFKKQPLHHLMMALMQKISVKFLRLISLVSVLDPNDEPLCYRFGMEPWMDRI